jgi:hypothetical protein
MTYKIITDDTGEEVCRSAIRSALDPTMKNLREDPIEFVKDPISLEKIFYLQQKLFQPRSSPML